MLDQIKEFFFDLQKKNDESFKHLSRKLETKMASGKVRLSIVVFLFVSQASCSF